MNDFREVLPIVYKLKLHIFIDRWKDMLSLKKKGGTLRGKNCDMSALPVTDPTLAAAAGEGG